MIIHWNTRTNPQVIAFSEVYHTHVTDPTVTITSIWSDAATNASTWYVQNPDETTWDTDGTFWDLDGNVYQTLWDSIDNTWSDETGNSTTWNDV